MAGEQKIHLSEKTHPMVKSDSQCWQVPWVKCLFLSWNLTRSLRDRKLSPEKLTERFSLVTQRTKDLFPFLLVDRQYEMTKQRVPLPFCSILSKLSDQRRTGRTWRCPESRGHGKWHPWAVLWVRIGICNLTWKRNRFLCTVWGSWDRKDSRASNGIDRGEFSLWHCSLSTSSGKLCLLLSQLENTPLHKGRINLRHRPA